MAGWLKSSTEMLRKGLIDFLASITVVYRCSFSIQTSRAIKCTVVKETIRDSKAYVVSVILSWPDCNAGESKARRGINSVIVTFKTQWFHLNANTFNVCLFTGGLAEGFESNQIKQLRNCHPLNERYVTFLSELRFRLHLSAKSHFKPLGELRWV